MGALTEYDVEQSFSAHMKSVDNDCVKQKIANTTIFFIEMKKQMKKLNELGIQI